MNTEKFSVLYRSSAAMLACVIFSASVPLAAAKENAISFKDVATVLTLSAKEADKKLGSEYCIKLALEPGVSRWAGDAAEDGWISPPNGASFRYLPLPSPDLAELPASAIERFTKAKVGENCSHKISFQNPKFIQIKSETENYIEADVNFSDQCPLCGFGAIIRFRKIDESWILQPPGVEGTWIS